MLGKLIGGQFFVLPTPIFEVVVYYVSRSIVTDLMYYWERRWDSLPRMLGVALVIDMVVQYRVSLLGVNYLTCIWRTFILPFRLQAICPQESLQNVYFKLFLAIYILYVCIQKYYIQNANTQLNVQQYIHDSWHCWNSR